MIKIKRMVFYVYIKKRWNNLVNRVERLESIVTPENAPSPLRQMKAAVREAFESGAHLAQQSEELNKIKKHYIP